MTLARSSFGARPVEMISSRRSDSNSRRNRNHRAAPQLNDNVFPVSLANAQQLVFRLALRITRNQEDAEDAQQEALLKAYRNLDQFQGRSRFTTWLSSIAINEALMFRRKHRNVIQIQFEDYLSQSKSKDAPSTVEWNSTLESAEEDYLRKELGSIVSSALAKLSPLSRDVFILRALKELSTTETAEALGVSIGVVKTRLRRARLQLRKLLRRTWESNAAGPSSASAWLGHRHSCATT